MALLDYKVSIGYAFDGRRDEDGERRVTDTFRVISLSFTNLGGPAAVPDYFTEFGHRSYEDRVYNNLGEHYLAKLRYDDAAKTFQSFVTLYPFHRNAPRFSMRVVETFTKAASRSSCWNRRRTSRRSTDCRPRTGSTSSPRSRPRSWAT
jgi:hypothetical protein